MINPKNTAEVPLEEVAMFGASRRQDQTFRALPGGLQCTWDGYGHRGALNCAAIHYAGHPSSGTVRHAGWLHIRMDTPVGTVLSARQSESSDASRCLAILS